MSPEKREQRAWRTRITRDLVLFVVGLGFAYNELIVRSGPERPSTLLFIAGLLGSPMVLRYIEASRKDREK